MRTLPRRTGRLATMAGVLALISTACLGGSNNGQNASPGASVSPITPVEPTKPVTITFSSWVGDSPQMKQFAADFHTLHPNITIQFQAVSADNSTTKLTTQVAGGTAPDVAFLEAEPFALPAFQWARALAGRGVPFGVQCYENIDRALPAPVRRLRSRVLRDAAFVAARSRTAGELARSWGARGEIGFAPPAVPAWERPPREPGDARLRTSARAGRC